MTALAGARVLVTRAEGEDEPLAAQLRARGAEALSLPCIAFTGPTDPAPLHAFLARLAKGERPDALVLASPQAARRLVAALRGQGLLPAALAGVLLGAAGEGTARELEALGLPGAIAPAHGAGADALAAALGPRLRGAKVALLRAEEGNPDLPRLLAEAGAMVEAVALYRTVPASPDGLGALAPAAQAALDSLRTGGVEVILFGSGSAARGFCGMLGPDAVPLAARALVACMGARCAEGARALGMRVDVVGQGGLPELLAAVEAVLQSSRAAAAGSVASSTTDAVTEGGPPALPQLPPAPGQLQLPAHKRPAGVDAIILYKLIKSGLSTVVGVLALVALNAGAEALSATLAQVLLDHFTRAWSLQLATLIVVAGTTVHIRIAAAAAFADAVLSSVEGLALRAGRWWAPWLVVFATGAFLPWEALEVAHHPVWGRFLILSLNLGVVVYLLRGVIEEHRLRER